MKKETDRDIKMNAAIGETEKQNGIPVSPTFFRQTLHLFFLFPLSGDDDAASSPLVVPSGVACGIDSASAVCFSVVTLPEADDINSDALSFWLNGLSFGRDAVCVMELVVVLDEAGEILWTNIQILIRR